MIIYLKPAQRYLRNFNLFKKYLISQLILFLIFDQVKGQFNLNPSRNKDQLDNLQENNYYVNQLQNHRITDQRISDSKPSGDQFVESNTIRVEDNRQNDSPPNRFTNRYLNTPNSYEQPSSITTKDTNNGLTNPISTYGSTIGSTLGTTSFSSVNPITSETAASNTISDHSNPSYATNNYETYPSQAITKTQMGRLQSTTPDTSQEYQNSPQGGNRYGPNGQPMQAYSPNSMGSMGSPSLISSIFSKFNQPMGSYYPYGNYGMYNYQNSYYPGSYYGSMYGSGYPSGNFISNLFNAKMRPIMTFFQRLTGKFSSPYSMYGGYSPYASYGGAYTNGMYNYGGDVYRNPLYKASLLQKDALTRKSDNARSLERTTTINNGQQPNPLSLLNAKANVPPVITTNAMTSSATRAASMQASGSDQRISSVHNLMVEKREAEENAISNSLKAIAKIKEVKEVPNENRKLLGEIVFEENQVYIIKAHTDLFLTDLIRSKAKCIYKSIPQSDKTVTINGELNGLSPGGHGFNIHELNGSMDFECTDYAIIGRHFNPTKQQHGGLNSNNRHLGDLGNLFVDPNGQSRIDLKTNLTLSGQHSILNKVIAITENVDDLGRNDNEGSKLDGNGGKIIACGYIKLVN